MENRKAIHIRIDYRNETDKELHKLWKEFSKQAKKEGKTVRRLLLEVLTEYMKDKTR